MYRKRWLLLEVLKNEKELSDFLESVSSVNSSAKVLFPGGGSGTVKVFRRSGRMNEGTPAGDKTVSQITSTIRVRKEYRVFFPSKESCIE